MNIISRYTSETGGNFMQDVGTHVFKLIAMYGIQVRYLLLLLNEMQSFYFCVRYRTYFPPHL